MKKNGFTLIEVISVMVILGIIMIIAIPAVAKYILSSDNATYATDVTAYLETARGEYEMKEYGSLLYDDEIMIVPFAYIELEKGTKESPYGEFVLDKSYMVVVPENNGYQFYANVVDETGHGVVMKKQQELSRDSIEENVKNEIISWKTYLDSETIFTIDGKNYSKCDLREKEGTEGSGIDANIIVLCKEN